MQIIVFALISGVGAYLAFVLVNLDGPLVVMGDDMMIVMLIMAAACIPVALVIPAIVVRKGNGNSSEMLRNPQTAALFTGDPINDVAIFVAMRIQVATIVACAMLEGSAFANAFALSTSGDAVHLGVVLALLLGIACRFPTRARYITRIERILEDAHFGQDDSFDR
ncbi:MAG: hypothetical protein CMJ48_01230 [Planctomycetaceae bacterium]|nr:hypothetical protein [Planctomycetaceae bacterium]